MAPERPRTFLHVTAARGMFAFGLFGGSLPQALVTLQRRPKMRGYFWAEQFRSRQ